MAMQVLIIIQMAENNFLVFYCNNFYTTMQIGGKLRGFTERRTTLSIELLNWGAQTPEAIGD